jgi:hypothetical protein
MPVLLSQGNAFANDADAITLALNCDGRQATTPGDGNPGYLNAAMRA